MNGFENSVHQNNPLHPPTALLWPLPPTLTPSNVFHPEWSHSTTRHSGICGPYREFALLSTRDHATIRGGHSSTHWGLRTPPLSSYFLFVNNSCQASSKAWYIHTFPFFVMRKNRANLAAGSWVCRTGCFWRLRCDRREKLLVPGQEWGGFRWRKSSCTFLGT